MASTKITRDCPVCGTAFTARADTKTCSRACGVVLRERGYSENGRPQLPAMPPEERLARVRQQRHAYYEANRERLLAANRRWHAENRAYRAESNQLWRLQNRAERTDKERQRRHGPDGAEAFAQMWQEQAGRCYLCDKSVVIEEMHMDHDHRCCPKNKSCRRCRRGLACKLCNVLIGDAGDDPALLRKIADRLEAARVLVTERLADKPVQEALL